VSPSVRTSILDLTKLITEEMIRDGVCNKWSDCTGKGRVLEMAGITRVLWNDSERVS